jgi:hypothetical protein
MSLMWFLKQLAGPKSSGFFAYLISRNQNKSRIELEKARQEAAADLIDHLPGGAVYRESTADGSREIWMPPLHALRLSVIPADSQSVHDIGILNKPSGADPESAQS